MFVVGSVEPDALLIRGPPRSNPMVWEARSGVSATDGPEEVLGAGREVPEFLGGAAGLLGAHGRNELEPELNEGEIG